MFFCPSQIFFYNKTVTDPSCPAVLTHRMTPALPADLQADLRLHPFAIPAAAHHRVLRVEPLQGVHVFA